MKNLLRPWALLLTALVSLSLTLSTAGIANAARATHAPSPVVKNDSTARVTAPVTGTTEDGRKVRGKFTPENVVQTADGLAVEGVVSGLITGKGKAKRFSEDVTMTVESINGRTLGDAPQAGRAGMAATAAAAPASCDILNLVLGPLDLNLLGLEVHLDQVVLDIVAKSGAGQLLGNLLCAVAGLLDGGSPLSGLLDQITGLLNDILGALNLGL